MSKNSPWVDCDTACHVLGVSAEVLARLVRSKRLAGSEQDGRVFVSKTSLDRLCTLPGPFFSVQTVAEVLEASEDTIRARIRAKKIKTVNILGLLRISASELTRVTS